jgi:hypothetical protein
MGLEWGMRVIIVTITERGSPPDVETTPPVEARPGLITRRTQSSALVFLGRAFAYLRPSWCAGNIRAHAMLNAQIICVISLHHGMYLGVAPYICTRGSVSDSRYGDGESGSEWGV